MKRIFLISGLVFLVFVAAIIAVPFLVPNSVYKAQIEKAATNALGRDVEVAGDVSISVFPGISASVADVSVANPDGFADDHMITAGALKGSVRLWPLLSRKVEINELEFVDADVRLVRLADGRANWMFGTGEEPAPEPDEDENAQAFSTTIGKFALQNASLSYDDAQTGASYRVTELDAETGFRSLDDTLSLKARGVFQDEPLAVDLKFTTPQSFLNESGGTLIFKLSSDMGRAEYEGLVSNGDEIGLDGHFNISAPQLGEIARFLDLDVGINLEPLGGLQLAGEVKGGLSALVFDFDSLELKAEALSATYSGTFSPADNLQSDGQLKLSVRDLASLLQEIGMPVEQLAPVQQLTLSSNVSGALLQPSLSNLDVRTSGPNLETSYKGNLSLAGKGRIDGDVSLQSGQVRSVLKQLGVELPEGDTLKTAKVQGKASGTFDNLLISAGTYAVDQTNATGSMGVDLTRAAPRIIADLQTDTLDLSPFLGSSQSQPGQSSGWSNTALDLEGLKLVNADIALRANQVSFGAIKLSDSVLKAKLNDGRLTTDFDQFKAFGGAWSGAMSVDASTSVPTFGFNLDADSVAAGPLLTALASFDKLTGTGGVSIKLDAHGSTINQIVNQLDGTVQLNLQNGALKGVNLGQLVRTAGTLSEQLAAGNLTLASLGTVVSPQAETDFTAFNASLDISDGIGRIGQMKLANSVLDVSGSGQINLGGRTLDLRLVPAIDRTGSGTASTVQLNGIPIPLRVSGNWAAPSFSPDFSGVQAALRQQIRDQAVDRVTERLDGELGSIVSGALGRDRPATTPNTAGGGPAEPDASADETAEPAEPEEEPEEEDPREKLVRDALGSIFGPN
ncbi:MAG: AsmA family protein [Henriciella sp.]